MNAQAQGDLLVTLAHLRSVPGLAGRPGYCLHGARAWFERHGLDFRAFARDGLPASVLLATGCALAQRLVAHATAAKEG